MNRPRDWLSAREASARLDVKLATLYAYASRGLVHSAKASGGRGRLYAADDVARLKQRHDARAGHAAVAAAALRWGEPTLETEVSEIRADEPYYRGHSVRELVEHAQSFECVAELLFTGVLPAHARRVRAPGFARALRAPGFARDLRAPRARPSIAGLAALVAQAALHDPRRSHDELDAELSRARFLLDFVAGSGSSGARAASVAERLLESLSVRARPEVVRRVDRALILCAEHELNASTFGARVAASAGASLFACVATGLHVLSGTRHGEVSFALERLLDAALRDGDVQRLMSGELSQGRLVPGFGHRLYPDGDPRCRALLALSAHGRKSKRLGALYALVEAMQRAKQPAPNLDLGLVALRCALGLPRGSASVMFAVGRTAGFIAHSLEQRAQGYLLRPRARYVGP